MSPVFSVIALALSMALSQSSSADQCANGGRCTEASDLGCQKCQCSIEFSGSYCQIILTKINGIVFYKKGQDIEYGSINYEEFSSQINFALNINSTINKPQEFRQTQKHISITFTFYIERPSSWTGYNDVYELLNPLEAQLSLEASVKAIFGTNENVTFVEVKLDVDECASNWHICNDSLSVCADEQPGYICSCEMGYEWNGTLCKAVFCLLSEAPKPPQLAEMIFSDENGTVISNPADILSYGTSIQYICEQRYDLVDKNGNIMEMETSTCQLSGWTPTAESSCAISMGFRVAIIMTLVSTVIILLVLCCLTTMHLYQKKKKKNEPEYTAPLM